MAEELDNNEIEILTLTDEDGADRDFEVVDKLEYEGSTYYALQEYFENVEDLDKRDEDEDIEIIDVDEDDIEDLDDFEYEEDE